jgi:DNA-binding response OmpR family regulator
VFVATDSEWWCQDGSVAAIDPDHGERLSVGLLTIDPGARRVWAGEDADEVELTGREFDLLLFLARHPGQVFSREQLMDAVWNHSSTRTPPR